MDIIEFVWLRGKKKKEPKKLSDYIWIIRLRMILIFSFYFHT